MKPTYIFLAAIAILMYNVVLIKRDQELLKAYDSMCAADSHYPRCRLSK